MSDKCRYEPCDNAPLPYPRYEGYCSEQCMTADEMYHLETENDELKAKLAEVEEERDGLTKWRIEAVPYVKGWIAESESYAIMKDCYQVRKAEELLKGAGE